jgi:glucokinase
MILKSMTKLLLAGDVGGTKTLLGLFERANPRPVRVHARGYGTLDFRTLPDLVDAFLRDSGTTPDRIGVACFGAAGPVIDRAAALTNVPWRVDAREVGNAFPFESVQLLNDLQAMAYSVRLLHDSELLVLQEGRAQADGNIAIIAAGTGLGEGLLHNVGGRWIPSPSEGGHADFAARTEREIVLTRDLTRRYGRADVEHVISGRGIVNLHRVCHVDGCKAGVDLEDPSAPATISAAALARTCPACVEVLDMFVEAYGAQAGNLALRSVATGGVFVGGGIAPKIVPAMTNGSFMRAFRDKAPLDAMLGAMPVKMVMNEEAGLIGAAVFANSI